MTYERTWIGRVFIGVSVDGFIARSDGDITWLTDPPQGRAHSRIDSSRAAESWETFFPAIDHVVMGRATYEKVLTFDEWPYEGKSVIVLSTTLSDEDTRITVTRDLDHALATLSDDGARQVYVDGGRVIQTFLRAGLIDEMTTSWMPVLIGEGIRLFGQLDADVHLTLLASDATDDGGVHATYRVERSILAP
ncbi:dihydrofolate reductase [Microbacterium halimionae]|uniref:Dihydrofolate reductase n=1 Tax=Microbacterium halimionae TaxID=1526413 RepID=A0A7W3JMD6_9MICO|nr:dihydrofolate reductase family protein [Microbacterium halimionae]MBA8815510.1 dihydrofolate reductase [Microbacterium halimionae]NII95557.1 dihydrofolate reductase [Microbacterium halimionae]